MDDPKTILVVDDEAPVLSVLTSLLKLQGYRVLTADDGNKALDLAMAHPVDAVLLDVNLPGMDGLMAAFHLHSNGDTRKLPVIVMSGAMDSVMIEEAHQLGCVSCLPKPFSLDSLAQALETALRAPLLPT